MNANSRSLSLASVSSDGSAESHLVEQEDIIALTQVHLITQYNLAFSSIPYLVQVDAFIFFKFCHTEPHLGRAALQRGTE